MTTEFIHDKPSSFSARLLLAHGAMAPMDSAFLNGFVALLLARKLAVARFEFPYMAARRAKNSRRPPPRAEYLMDDYVAAVDDLHDKDDPAIPLIIGGKSLGSRVATMVAKDLFRTRRISGVVCIGYPFHPIRRSGPPRIAHLAQFSAPCLILQGERDPFGARPEIAAFNLDPRIELHWAPDGDHDLKPRRLSGHSQQGNLKSAADAVARFCQNLSRDA
ncbi:MAG: alpha/beta family hydrolase [Hyphomicrobiaceae bacterium]